MHPRSGSWVLSKMPLQEIMLIEIIDTLLLLGDKEPVFTELLCGNIGLYYNFLIFSALSRSNWGLSSWQTKPVHPIQFSTIAADGLATKWARAIAAMLLILFSPLSLSLNVSTSAPEELTHLSLDKMAAISQTIFSDVFSWMKSFVFWLKFQWSLFLRVKFTITHRFR